MYIFLAGEEYKHRFMNINTYMPAQGHKPPRKYQKNPSYRMSS